MCWLRRHGLTCVRNRHGDEERTFDTHSHPIPQLSRQRAYAIVDHHRRTRALPRMRAHVPSARRRRHATARSANALTGRQALTSTAANQALAKDKQRLDPFGGKREGSVTYRCAAINVRDRAALVRDTCECYQLPDNAYAAGGRPDDERRGQTESLNSGIYCRIVVYAAVTGDWKCCLHLDPAAAAPG